MPIRDEKVLEAIRDFQATLIKLTSEPSGDNRGKKRPRHGSTPERKRRKRSDRSRHNGSQQRLRQERLNIIQETLQEANLPRSARQRPRLSQGNARSSRSPPTKTPEAAHLHKTAAYYGFHPAMSEAMVEGYSNGSIPYKSFERGNFNSFYQGR